MICRDTEERMCHHKSCHNQGAKQATGMFWPYNTIVTIFGKLFCLLKCLLAAHVWPAWRKWAWKKGRQQGVPSSSQSQRPTAVRASHTSLLIFFDWLLWVSQHSVHLLPLIQPLAPNSSWCLSVSEISPWEFCAQSWRHFWGPANLTVSLLSILYQVSVSLWGPALQSKNR